MRKYILHFFLCALFLAPAAPVLATVITIKSSTYETETRNVSGFTGISSGGSFDVKVTLGSKESVRLEGPSDKLDDIETVVEQGVLKIRTKKGVRWNWPSRETITIYVTAKSLNSLSVSGSGEMDVEGTVSGEKLNASVSGSGSLDARVSVKAFTGSISGSGEISISGSATNSTISISGSGEFNGYDLKTSTTSVRTSGSGDAQVYADKTLNAVVSGSGDISYRGGASVSKTKSGSGSISKD